MRYLLIFAALLSVIGLSRATAAEETLPALGQGESLNDFRGMWAGFDPRDEPLEVETLKEWEEDGVVLRVVRFRIGVFKGEKAVLAAVYGYPKGGKSLPGLVQIHGGGQYADSQACLKNARRGYATVSIAWAGRINAPDYRVTPKEVRLFWDGKTDDPAYKLTTDWGAVDGYHAPGRNPGNVFPAAKSAEFTLDEVESPRNSGWFLCAVAARRALTFLERQPEVDPDRLGVYGHSMGGKLTVMTAVDDRVKAAAPSCGGISDRYNKSPLFRTTIGDDVSLKQISCPIIFLSPANDFHGRIGDLPDAVNEIKSKQWRVTCSPHHNHQDTPPYEAATLLWFDQHLKHAFEFPPMPVARLKLDTANGVPIFAVRPDQSMPILAVDIYYTQHGKANELPQDMENTKHRFWRSAKAKAVNGVWTAPLQLMNARQPLWAYANIRYELSQPITGAGYYYGEYTADSFNLSSVVAKISAKELASAGVRATLKPSLMIESFEDGWESEWFTYKPADWARSTHKLYDAAYRAPKNARLAIDVLTAEPNQLVILIDDHAAVVDLNGGDTWQEIVVSLTDFRNLAGGSLTDWSSVKSFKLSPAERLRSGRGEKQQTKIVGRNWQGEAPRFRNLRWVAEPDAPGDSESSTLQGGFPGSVVQP